MGLLDKLFGKKKNEEITPGGSPIYRYGSQEGKKLQVPENTGTYLEEIEAHFDALFPGRESFVFHEIVSDIVHIDVHVMHPTQEQPFHVVYTSGMSDKPMNIPDELSKQDRQALELAELYVLLPGSWDLGGEGKSGTDISPAHFWPIQMLKFLARFPHTYQTWLGWGHTIPNGPEYSPLYDGVGFGGVVLMGGTGDGPLSYMTAKDGHRVNFYNMVPAYKEEIEYKLKYGMSALEKVFQEKGLSLILESHRPNLCADFKEILDS